MNRDRQCICAACLGRCRARISCWSGLRPAQYAAPIYTLLMANCPTPNCPLFLVMKSWGEWWLAERMPEAFPLASGLVFPGWVGLVASASIAVVAMKIYVKVPNLPVIKSMAAMLNIPSLTRVIVSVFPRLIAMSRPRPCYAPDLLVIGRLKWPEAPIGWVFTDLGPRLISWPRFCVMKEKSYLRLRALAI